MNSLQKRASLGGLVAVAVASVVAAAPCDFFPPPQSVLTTPNGATQLAVADFDGDGHDDIASIGFLGADVFLGAGDGSFSLPWSIRNVVIGPDRRSPARGQSIGTGDLDGDGVMDLVLGYAWRSEFGYFSPLLGNGDGTFRLVGTFGPYYLMGPTSMLVGDFDGDGQADVVSASGNSRGKIGFLKGNGDGSLGPQRSSNIFAESIVADDFDGDGVLDLAVALNGGGFSIVRGLGDGRFSGTLFHHERVDYCEDWDGDGVDDDCYPSPGRTVALADVDADGISDLVVRSDNRTIDVLRGLGGASFEPWAVLSGSRGSGYRSPALAADLDGDGRVDVVDVSESGSFVVMRQQDDGSFVGDDLSVGVGGSNLSLVLVDFDHDGDLDVAAGDANSRRIVVAINDGAGGFPPDRRLAGTSAMSLAAGDVDGDGDLDLVGGSRFGSYEVLKNDGTGNLARAGVGSTASGVPSVSRLADLNEDGRLDLVMNASSDRLTLHAGNGDGTFGPYASLSTGRRPNDFVVGDVNGDAHLDLISANSSSNDVSVLLGHGDGTFEPQVLFAVGRSPRSVGLGDLDGDGRADLVTANASDANLSLLIGNGDGTFTSAGRLAVDRFPSYVTIGDVNADGRLDVLSAGSRTLSLLLGNGDGSFEPERRLALPGSVGGHPLLADVDLDGRIDVIVSGSGFASVLMGFGDGTFLEPRSLALGAGSGGVYAAVADLNGDNLPDLAVPGWQSREVSIILNPGDTTAPEIRSVAFDGSCQWAPNHALACIEDVPALVDAVDECDDAPPEVRVIACESSQPDDGLGDGNTEGDCEISEDGRSVCLRSERSGLEREGRRYRVTLAATDRSGNVALHEAEVTVHHDRRDAVACR